jgi:hypothetical protein
MIKRHLTVSKTVEAIATTMNGENVGESFGESGGDNVRGNAKTGDYIADKLLFLDYKSILFPHPISTPQILDASLALICQSKLFRFTSTAEMFDICPNPLVFCYLDIDIAAVSNASSTFIYELGVSQVELVSFFSSVPSIAMSSVFIDHNLLLLTLSRTGKLYMWNALTHRLLKSLSLASVELNEPKSFLKVVHLDGSKFLAVFLNDQIVILKLSKSSFDIVARLKCPQPDASFVDLLITNSNSSLFTLWALWNDRSQPLLQYTLVDLHTRSSALVESRWFTHAAFKSEAISLDVANEESIDATFINYITQKDRFHPAVFSFFLNFSDDQSIETQIQNLIAEQVANDPDLQTFNIDLISLKYYNSFLAKLVHINAMNNAPCSLKFDSSLSCVVIHNRWRSLYYIRNLDVSELFAPNNPYMVNHVPETALPDHMHTPSSGLICQDLHNMQKLAATIKLHCPEVSRVLLQPSDQASRVVIMNELLEDYQNEQEFWQYSSRVIDPITSTTYMYERFLECSDPSNIFLNADSTDLVSSCLMDVLNTRYEMVHNILTAVFFLNFTNRFDLDLLIKLQDLLLAYRSIQLIARSELAQNNFDLTSESPAGATMLEYMIQDIQPGAGSVFEKSLIVLQGLVKDPSKTAVDIAIQVLEKSQPECALNILEALLQTKQVMFLLGKGHLMLHNYPQSRYYFSKSQYDRQQIIDTCIEHGADDFVILFGRNFATPRILFQHALRLGNLTEAYQNMLMLDDPEEGLDALISHVCRTHDSQFLCKNSFPGMTAHLESTLDFKARAQNVTPDNGKIHELCYAYYISRGNFRKGNRYSPSGLFYV